MFKKNLAQVYSLVRYINGTENEYKNIKCHKDWDTNMMQNSYGYDIS